MNYMIKIIEVLLITIMFILLSGNSNNAKPDDTNKFDYYLFKENSFNKFLEKLAWNESRGNCTVINRYGYMGKYQIGELALKDIGMNSITVNKFRKDSTIFSEDIQEIAIRKCINNNRKYLGDYIENHKNTTINGIFITESSLIAASHLVGQKHVKRWLKSKGRIKKSDANGTSIESYLKLFSGYCIIY